VTTRLILSLRVFIELHRISIFPAPNFLYSYPAHAHRHRRSRCPSPWCSHPPPVRISFFPFSKAALDADLFARTPHRKSLLRKMRRQVVAAWKTLTQATRDDPRLSYYRANFDFVTPPRNYRRSAMTFDNNNNNTTHPLHYPTHPPKTGRVGFGLVD
jgi:hypothetical protein